MGRPKSSTRAFIEESAVLEVQRIPQITPFPKGPWETIWIGIMYVCPLCQHPWIAAVQITTTPVGLRFVCPKCQRKVHKIFLPPAVALDNWACRDCHRLAYLDQYKKEQTDLAVYKSLGLLRKVPQPTAIRVCDPPKLEDVLASYRP